MVCNAPGSSVRGILQARTVEWVAVPSSRGSSRPRNQSYASSISRTGRRVPYHECHLGSPRIRVGHRGAGRKPWVLTRRGPRRRHRGHQRSAGKGAEPGTRLVLKTDAAEPRPGACSGKPQPPTPAPQSRQPTRKTDGKDQRCPGLWRGGSPTPMAAPHSRAAPGLSWHRCQTGEGSRPLRCG